MLMFSDCQPPIPMVAEWKVPEVTPVHVCLVTSWTSNVLSVKVCMLAFKLAVAGAAVPSRSC